MLIAINIDPDLPNLKQSSLYKLLKELDVEFLRRNRKNIIVDRDDIVLWHRRYLLKIRELRQKGSKLHYLDETWVNEDHTTAKVLQHTASD